MANWMQVDTRTGQASVPDEDENELFVFGYQCKIFRDDEKAKFIDGGKHLIPWMGDPSLFIDRYDGRGHLFDLRMYDADFVPKNRALSEEEEQIEALCDEERYLELHTDVSEKRLYEEEELKRLNEAVNESSYGAVGFNYNTPREQTQTENHQDLDVTVEKEPAFVPPPELRIPSGMIIPETEKHNAILEKTAEFISKQSTQMEIVIKTKQQHNPQFNFLQYGNPLYPYYKHLVQEIKTGRYRPAEKTRPVHTVREGPGQPQVPELSTGEMLAIVRQKLPEPQIHNTSYATLVSKLSKHTTGRNSPNLHATTQPPPTAVEVAPTAASAATQPVPHASSSAKPQLYVQGEDYNAPSTSHQPLLLHPSVTTDTSHVAYQHPLPAPDDRGGGDGETGGVMVASCQPPPPGTVPPTATTAYNGHDTLGSQEPEADMKAVIDRMALYVIRNGPDFEAVVKEKNDPRFEFMTEGHRFYQYYVNKKATCKQEQASQIQSASSPRKHDKHLKHTSNKSISFSIKAKDQELSGVESNKRTLALLYESSSEDESEDDSSAVDNGTSGGAGLMVQGQGYHSGTHSGTGTPTPTEGVSPRAVATNTSAATAGGSNGTAAQPKPPIDPEEMRRKLAEDRLAAKLTAAAKEKLAQANREKQMQVERKRKAAMFISMLSTKDPAPTATTVPAASGDSINTADDPPDTEPRPQGPELPPWCNYDSSDSEEDGGHNEGAFDGVPLATNLFDDTARANLSPAYNAQQQVGCEPPAVHAYPTVENEPEVAQLPLPQPHPSLTPLSQSDGDVTTDIHSPSSLGNRTAESGTESINTQSRQSSRMRSLSPAPPPNNLHSPTRRDNRNRSIPPADKTRKRSPRRRSKSPAKRTRSPKRRSRSPTRRPGSPTRSSRRRSSSRSRAHKSSKHKRRSRSRSPRHKHKRRSLSRSRKRSRSRSNEKHKKHKKHKSHKKRSHSRDKSESSRRKRKEEKKNRTPYIAPDPSEVIAIDDDDDEPVTILTSPEPGERLSSTDDNTPSGSCTPMPTSGTSTPRPFGASIRPTGSTASLSTLSHISLPATSASSALPSTSSASAAPLAPSTTRPDAQTMIAQSKVSQEMSQDLLLKVRAMLKASKDPT